MDQSILFLAPTGQMGGAERCLLDTLWSFQKHHPQLRKWLIAGSHGGLIQAAYEQQTRVQIIPLPDRMARLGDSGLGRSPVALILLLLRMLLAWPQGFLYLRRLRREIRRIQPSLVHVLGLKMQMISLMVVPREIPVVWNVQDYIGQRRIVRIILRLVTWFFGQNRALAAGCCSDDVVRDFLHVIGRKRFQKVVTIGNSVDLEMFRPDGLTVPQLAKPHQRVEIGFVATYARWKGQALLLEALADLAGEADLPEWHGWIVGGPIYQTSGSQWSPQELQAMARSLNLNSYVSFLPFQENPAQVMRGFDILVHCSTRPEPFGRVIAEGQASGVAVVAVNSGGSAEVFREGESGLGVEINNRESLRQAIRRLLTDPSLRQKLADQGPEWVASRFDRERLAEQWHDLYQTVL